MKVARKTAEYTIYRKRNQRYAVRNAAKAWVNADEKVRILLEEGLITVTPPSTPETAEDAEPAEESPEDAGAQAADDGEETTSE